MSVLIWPFIAPSSKIKIMQKDNKLDWLALLIMMVWGFIVFGVLLNGSFLGDDVTRILEQKEFFDQGLFETLANIVPDRPFMMFTIWVNYIFSGFTHTFGYKLVNILVQVGAGYALYLVLQMLGWLHFRKKEVLLPLLCGLIYMVHPFHNTSVIQVIQRGTSLSALFFLLSFYFFLKQQENKKQLWVALSLFCYLLSLLSKPISIVLPLILASYIFFFSKGKKNYRQLLPYIIFTFVPFLIHLFPHTTLNLIPVHAEAPYTWSRYAFIQLGVILKYFVTFLFPYKTYYFHAINTDPTPYAWWSYLGLVLHPLILGFVFFSQRVNSFTKFCVLAMYLSFLPESSVHAIKDVMFMHRNALSCIFMVALVYQVARGLKINPLLFLLPFILLFSFFTFQRNQIAKNWVTWNRDFVDSNPGDHAWYQRYMVGLIFNSQWSPAQAFLKEFNLVQKYPDHPEYKLYELTILGFYPENNQVGGVENLGNLLVSPQFFGIDIHSRRTLNMFIFHKLQEMLPSPKAELRMEELFYRQLQLFFQGRPFFDQELAQYKKFFDLALEKRMEKYSTFEVNKKSTENPQEYLDYLRLLRLNKKLFSKDTPELPRLFENFRKKYPGNPFIEAEYQLLETK